MAEPVQKKAMEQQKSGGGAGGGGADGPGNSEGAVRTGTAGADTSPLKAGLINLLETGKGFRTFIITGGEKQGVAVGMPVTCDFTPDGDEMAPTSFTGKILEKYPFRSKVRFKVPPEWGPESLPGKLSCTIGRDGNPPPGKYDGGQKAADGKAYADPKPFFWTVKFQDVQYGEDARPVKSTITVEVQIEQAHLKDGQVTWLIGKKIVTTTSKEGTKKDEEVYKATVQGNLENFLGWKQDAQMSGGHAQDRKLLSAKGPKAG